MIRSTSRCSNCGAERAGLEPCPSCGLAYVEARKPHLEDNNPEADRSPEERHQSAFEFGNSHVEPVLIGIVLLLGIVLLYCLGYLN